MNISFYVDPESGDPHIYRHGVNEREVDDVLKNPGEDRPGRESSRVAIRANAKSLGRPYVRHCEEHSDEAISILSMGDCFATLAMTYRAALSDDFAFALEWPLVELVQDVIFA